MLKKQTTRLVRVGADARFAIIASRYNARYVDGMLAAAQREFKRAGAKPGQVRVVRVPGAFEIPAVVSRLARDRKADAIVCLGVILRGQTSHAHHIGEAISHALAQIQVSESLPVIHEVLLFEDESQARVRCLGKEINRGAEAARTAIEMAEVMRGLNQERQ
jgi:6,7-dimethyl-8-ribityllumazine synthase